MMYDVLRRVAMLVGGQGLEYRCAVGRLESSTPVGPFLFCQDIERITSTRHVHGRHGRAGDAYLAQLKSQVKTSSTRL